MFALAGAPGGRGGQNCDGAGAHGTKLPAAATSTRAFWHAAPTGAPKQRCQPPLPSRQSSGGLQSKLPSLPALQKLGGAQPLAPAPANAAPPQSGGGAHFRAPVASGWQAGFIGGIGPPGPHAGFGALLLSADVAVGGGG